MIALLVPAVQKVREAAARTQTINNMKQIAIANINHQDTFRTFATPKALKPPQGPEAVDLSWRVSLLPFIEQNNVFNAFDKTLPWDNPRNQQFLNPMPPPYTHISRDAGPGGTTTFFQYFTGPGTLWPDNGKRKLQDITDGTSNTFLFAEADRGASRPTWSFNPASRCRCLTRCSWSHSRMARSAAWSAAGRRTPRSCCTSIPPTATWCRRSIATERRCALIMGSCPTLQPPVRVRTAPGSRCRSAARRPPPRSRQLRAARCWSAAGMPWTSSSSAATPMSITRASRWPSWHACSSRPASAWRC